MAAKRLLLAAAIFVTPALTSKSGGKSPEVTAQTPGTVDEREATIDNQHEVAIEALDRVIEASPFNTPSTQIPLVHFSPIAASPFLEASPSTAQTPDSLRAQSKSQRVEALETALAAADQQNKALEAALAAADQQNKVLQGAEDSPLRQGLNLRARRKIPQSADDAKKMSSSSPETEDDASNTDEEPSNSTREMLAEESAMERTLTDLMLNSKVDGTPFGTSVKQIAKLIRKKMMPAVTKAHDTNQKHLDKLAKDIARCGASKDRLMASVDINKATYLKMSPLHKSCRTSEAAMVTEKTECFNGLKDKKRIKDLKCKAFGMNSKKYGDQQANRQIVKKGGSESTDSYITRITSTICGKNPPPANLDGGGKGGFLDMYLKAKAECVNAAKEFNTLAKKCTMVGKGFDAKRAECDSLQDQMDGASCKRATEAKDACESYAACYSSKRKALTRAVKMVKSEEKARKAEWRGLKRMECLIKGFSDGDVSRSEVRRCRKRTYPTDHLDIEYPKVPEMASCTVPDRYPTTAAYKLAEFAPLPALAKGKKDEFECSGVIEIPTTPPPGSPTTCKCERVTLNGPYSAGPLVKCSNCLDTRRSSDANSCPAGTKLFSPRSARDWKTVLSSIGKLKEPYFIVDVTRPQNGCGECTAKAMNSGPGGQPKAWRTSDGSAWWLHGKPYTEPNGNYHANCYLAMFSKRAANKLKFDDDNCKFHSNSYYCQLEALTTTPKEGSPTSCKCDPVVLTGPYSAGALIKCTACLKVSKSTQKNSCPLGTKLFSPATSNDWKTFISSAQPLRSPHFIIDITRPQNGCGGCTKYAMKFSEPAQRTWRTADGSPWWLRSTKYSEPSGDYTANCYMDLWHTPPDENSVTFNDGKCGYYSTSYYCQPVKAAKKK